MVETKELFMQAYPHADLNKFSFGPTYITFNHGGMGYDVFVGKVGRGQKIHHYDDPEIAEALQTALGKPWKPSPRFRPEFTLQTRASAVYPIPAADISLSLKELRTNLATLLNPLMVHVTPKESFTIRLPDVFRETPPGVSNESEMTSWLSGPNLHMFDQQRNLAVWCATSGCGIAWNILEPDTQIACFLRFHVLFTVRQILFQLGCPPPWEGKFNYRDNLYSEAGLQALRREFNLQNPLDFRFKGTSTEEDVYGVKWKGAYFKSTHKDRQQYNWFVPKNELGLTRPGLGRLNRSVEAFVYCVLAAQARTRSTIVSIEGESGDAVETQQVFATLFADTIKNDISSSVQRFQKAVFNARVRLDLAISPGLWLLPSRW
ncbi:hypothetical protein QZH41_000087 [Actinostola sp. cb2023]|nr:hypothetical protein QZH41_000087 [Actinostola sp. cb2023]